MKIGLLSSHRAQKQYEQEYWEIIHFLEKKGYEVMHSMDTKIDDLLHMNYTQREKIFFGYYKQLESCDIIIAEISVQSTQVGIGLSYLRDKGKPVVVASMKGAQGYFCNQTEMYSEVENMMVIEYDRSDMLSKILEAIEYMQEKLDKRFTMIFPAHLMAKLEEHSHKKRLPKAVYIRQILEKTIQEEDMLSE